MLHHASADADSLQSLPDIRHIRTISINHILSIYLIYEISAFVGDIIGSYCRYIL